MSKNHCLIFDPIPFKGGSKIATSEALALTNARYIDYTIITVDKEFWQTSTLANKHQVNIVPIHPIPWLNRRYHGFPYWLNQVCLMLVVWFYTLKLRNITSVIGASGPGIDMPLYLLQLVKSVQLVQFVHGDVAESRSIGWCLTKANKVFYLPSSRSSIRKALRRYLTQQLKLNDTRAIENNYFTSPRYVQFVNGISQEKWPSRSHVHFPICFWAASLLRWKGLDLFVNALRHCHQRQPVASQICFIRPSNSAIGVSIAPVALRHTQWFQDPENLDEIRAQCNIFVSTSHKEPFGLSILEALAAGMCVIIPQDGSYWDGKLIDQQDCIKYQPQDTQSLSKAILSVYKDPVKLNKIRTRALEIASEYRAEATYSHLVSTIEHLHNPTQLNQPYVVKD